MNLFISPHNDDAALFGCFTLIREKPLVLTVTDSWIQSNRGDNITADQRWQEDIEAMNILGCPLIRGGIRDDVCDEWAVRKLLSKFVGFEIVYAPAIQGGNKDHDIVGKIAQEIFKDKVKQYSTYTPTELYTVGTEEIRPTPPELELKERVLACYTSQLNLSTTKPHFEAVKGKSEWFL